MAQKRGANKLNDLTAEQRQSLQFMLPILGLAADLSHGVVTVYLPTGDKKFLHVFKQQHPLTQVGENRVDMTGRRVRSVEEPLVTRAMQMNIPVTGKREWKLGTIETLHTLKVFPLRDVRGHAYGAISFEVTTDEEIIIAQCLELLTNMRQAVGNNPNYARMQPSDGIMVVDPNKMVIAANRRARYLFDVMGIPEIVGNRTNGVAINWPLVGMVMDTGIAESKELDMHGLLLSIRILPVIARPRAGCVIVIIKDITELHQKDEELLIQSVVIKEIHHRVKNNLQTITSLLRMQERRAQADETKTVLRDCIGRVNSIAIVHEYLSQQDTGLIDVEKVAKGIYRAILSSMVSPDLALETRFEVESLQLPSNKATSLALILNELLQNALEHAFTGRTHGRLDISFTKESEGYHLTIMDDGIGLPENFAIDGRKSLGLKIIRTMAEADLQGSFILQNRPEGGTKAVVMIPQSAIEP